MATETQTTEKVKKIIGRVGWIATGVGVIALLIAGVSTESINSGIALIDVAVTAVGAVLAYFAGKWKSK